MVVQSLIVDHGMSQRRACVASGTARSTLRYAPTRPDDSGVIEFVQRHIASNPRHGFGVLHDSARYQAQPWGKTVLWRVYCQLHLKPAQAWQEAAASAHKATVVGRCWAKPELELRFHG